MANSFHTSLDARPDPPSSSRADSATTPVLELPYVVFERERRFRFSTHFHPYVTELIQRLVDGSVPGLESADTEFATPVTLSAAASARTADDQIRTLAAGEVVRLADGTRLVIAGDTVRLAGARFVRAAEGSPDAGSPLASPAAGSPATLGARTRVTLGTGERVTLDADASVRLAGGDPTLALHEALFSPDSYAPNAALVSQPYPVKDLDFTSGGAYAIYNWELFFHVPLTLAIHLSRNQRFAEAQRWFHYVFDPTDDSDGPTPERFWKARPFQLTRARQIEELLVNLSTGGDPALRDVTIQSIQAWRDAPFQPHVVAQYRPWAYMLETLMAYLDNLIAWGDARFREDTGESINEATQIYVLAANILGPRAQAIPSRGRVRPQTYASMRDGVDAFGNVLRELEVEIPFDSAPAPLVSRGDATRDRTLHRLDTLNFCIPRNEKLLEYWDTVADRLFKIRNSLNIQGTFRQIPLFEPPIDPALLARATAAGLDVAAIVSGAAQPLPLVRFHFLAQKAGDICQEVKSLGNQLLSAIEKEDNEALSILRAQHERRIMSLAEAVRYGQYQEAIKAREALEKSLANAIQRYTYYERLLGRQESDIQVPALEALDAAGLTEMRFASSEPVVEPRAVAVDIAPHGPSALNQASLGLLGTGDVTGGRLMNRQEREELELLELARLGHGAASQLDILAAGLGLIPQFDAHGTPLGVGVATGFGGVQLSRMTGMLASFERGLSDTLSYSAGTAAKMGGYARREQEWTLQSNLAAGEITQMHKQLRAAQIREAVAGREWTNHQQQVRHAEEIETFFTDASTGKKANRAFYAWMKREVRGLYGQCFQLAFEVARKAERALRHELGEDGASFLQPAYLGGNEGLLAGERLHLDIKRMEVAYQDLNRREYELTKHVSLLHLDPAALLRLRATGTCTLSLPETLFDMDGPGHYFRRLRSVAVSIPAVTGPYASVNCTLTLIRSTIRKSPALPGGNEYARQNDEDPRFEDYFGGLQSIVTSTAQNDSGLFDATARDDRYVPFEGSGTISEWRLDLPSNPARGEPQQFDYDTIADVILHLRYTARDGGAPLRERAIARLKASIDEAQAGGSVRLLSVRHEFSTEWARFKNAGSGPVRLTLALRPEHYPFWSQASRHAVRSVDLFARIPPTAAPLMIYDTADRPAEPVATLGTPALGDLRTARLRNVTLPRLTGDLTMYLSDNLVEDLWLALTWGLPL